MAGKTQKKGFFSNWIVRNITIAVVLVVVLAVGAMVFLNVVTQHNREIDVPDFSNLSHRLCVCKENEEGSSLQTESGCRFKGEER